MPERTCVACRAKRCAAELERITVWNGDFIRGGPSRGRGAWVCSERCFSAAVDNGTLNRALRVNHRVRR